MRPTSSRLPTSAEPRRSPSAICSSTAPTLRSGRTTEAVTTAPRPARTTTPATATASARVIAVRRCAVLSSAAAPANSVTASLSSGNRSSRMLKDSAKAG